MVMCILSLFNHLPNANAHAHTQCLFVHLRVRKVEIWWTKMDGLIFHSSSVLLWTFISYSCCKSSYKYIPLCYAVFFFSSCVFLFFIIILFLITGTITSSSIRLDTVKSEYIRVGEHVRCFGDKAREVRRWWCGHVQRRDRKSVRKWDGIREEDVEAREWWKRMI